MRAFPSEDADRARPAVAGQAYLSLRAHTPDSGNTPAGHYSLANPRHYAHGTTASSSPTTTQSKLATAYATVLASSKITWRTRAQSLIESLSHFTSFQDSGTVLCAARYGVFWEHMRARIMTLPRPYKPCNCRSGVSRLAHSGFWQHTSRTLHVCTPRFVS